MSWVWVFFFILFFKKELSFFLSLLPGVQEVWSLTDSSPCMCLAVRENFTNGSLILFKRCSFLKKNSLGLPLDPNQIEASSGPTIPTHIKWPPKYHLGSNHYLHTNFFDFPGGFHQAIGKKGYPLSSFHHAIQLGVSVMKRPRPHQKREILTTGSTINAAKWGTVWLSYLLLTHPHMGCSSVNSEMVWTFEEEPFTSQQQTPKSKSFDGETLLLNQPYGFLPPPQKESSNQLL